MAFLAGFVVANPTSLSHSVGVSVNISSPTGGVRWAALIGTALFGGLIAVQERLELAKEQILLALLTFVGAVFLLG